MMYVDYGLLLMHDNGGILSFRAEMTENIVLAHYKLMHGH